MKTIASIFLCSLAMVGKLYAQQVITSGKIVYEKKVNIHKQIDELTDQQSIKFMSELKNKTDVYQVSHRELLFNETQTSYKPVPELPDNPNVPDWFIPCGNSVIYNDLAADSILSLKILFGKTYLLAEKNRKINWKNTDETRMISGFLCKKAVATIMDSIYVIAFYTDDIVSSGGPETFSGLPGMMLGLAIPGMYTTWFATEVTPGPTTPTNAFSDKAKKVDEATFEKEITPLMKNYGPAAPHFLWKILL